MKKFVNNRRKNKYLFNFSDPRQRLGLRAFDERLQPAALDRRQLLPN